MLGRCARRVCFDAIETYARPKRFAPGPPECASSGRTIVIFAVICPKVESLKFRRLSEEYIDRAIRVNMHTKSFPPKAKASANVTQLFTITRAYHGNSVWTVKISFGLIKQIL